MWQGATGGATDHLTLRPGRGGYEHLDTASRLVRRAGGAPQRVNSPMEPAEQSAQSPRQTTLQPASLDHRTPWPSAVRLLSQHLAGQSADRCHAVRDQTDPPAGVWERKTSRQQLRWCRVATHHRRFGHQQRLENCPRVKDLQSIVVLLRGTVDRVAAGLLRHSWGGEEVERFEPPATRLPDADCFVHHVRPDEQDNLVAHLVGSGEATRPRFDIKLRRLVNPMRMPLFSSILEHESSQALPEGPEHRLVIDAAAEGRPAIPHRSQQAVVEPPGHEYLHGLLHCV
eukprot:4893552-Prymnesium_polylepis.1